MYLEACIFIWYAFSIVGILNVKIVKIVKVRNDVRCVVVVVIFGPGSWIMKWRVTLQFCPLPPPPLNSATGGQWSPGPH